MDEDKNNCCNLMIIDKEVMLYDYSFDRNYIRNSRRLCVHRLLGVYHTAVGARYGRKKVTDGSGT